VQPSKRSELVVGIALGRDEESCLVPRDNVVARKEIIIPGL